jgi:AraC-like DNA-binding protein
MPREFVDERALRAEHWCVRPPKDNGITRLFVDTLFAFARDADSLNEEEFCVTNRLVGELALLAVGSSADLSTAVRSVRTCNLARAKRAMRLRLSDPDLTLTDIANGCGISLRYLHDLFRDEGMTAREYLQGERLQRARLLLQSACGQGVTVTAVALTCGFANSSQFSTAFRRAFGLSPRDVLRRR